MGIYVSTSIVNVVDNSWYLKDGASSTSSSVKLMLELDQSQLTTSRSCEKVYVSSRTVSTFQQKALTNAANREMKY